MKETVKMKMKKFKNKKSMKVFMFGLLIENNTKQYLTEYVIVANETAFS